MKRFSLLCVLAILCSLPAYSQFWISFGWNEPHCQNCLWMEQAMHLPARQAAEYHKIIHKYGQKIEKEARRDYRYWDRAARRIYDLRMERDRKVQRILTPAQFNLYVRFVREHPQRIHDYRGWYANPRYRIAARPMTAVAMRITIGITAGVPFTMTIIGETTGMTQIDIGIVTIIVMTIGNQRNRISPNLKRIRRIGTIEKNGIIAMGERSNNSTIA